MEIKYRLTNYLGSGAYGTVAKALDFKWGNTVAVKTSSCIDVAFQESEILNLLFPSRYVVQILGRGKAEIVQGCFLKETTKNNVTADEIAYIAMEFMDMDLLSFIKRYIHEGYSYNNYYFSNNGPELVKGLMWELCCGVAYCHDMGVAHRDLKPSNCLLSISKEGAIKIKLADFGLATTVKDKRNGLMERNGKEYVSLWYRAPELLMQQQKTYNCFAIDVWALGCIFAEMVIGEPIFCGQCPEEQLILVFQHVGGSSFEMITALVQLFSRHYLSSFDLQNRLESTAEKMGYSIGMDLLVKMLQVDPNKRLTAKQCLQHPYFSCFHQLNSWST
ncbi:hypothetical protein SUGI_0814310 [Cryptomeria japonica]|uniref:cyclin-dependent kinase B1-1-like n=1 Tax=Cryptomeria japonica TaxID=3369 RepID=UPI0024146DF1|nr:cyclin-dependent kinase B1-1-like [Cryptomeria japonica]GLJ39834.1 hypothetical protein SUGI_0814310 [Cryptomeria japonica]